MLRVWNRICALGGIALTLACATAPAPPPTNWNISLDPTEYEPYMAGGSASIFGQAFLRTVGGDVKVAAGSTVTLDPFTSYSHHWWHQAGKWWARRSVIPPEAIFSNARKVATADADGRFGFEGLAAGRYYVRTQVTWETGAYRFVNDTQGGLIWQLVHVEDGQKAEIVLTWPNPDLP